MDRNFQGKRYRNEDSQSNEGRRHPKHLKGREIGLWYASRNKSRRGPMTAERKQQKEERINQKRAKIERKPLGSILLSDTKKDRINELLKETASIYPTATLRRTDSYEHLEESEFKHEFLQHISGSIMKKLETSVNKSFPYKDENIDDLYFEEMEKKKSDSLYKKMQLIREKLPAMSKREDILKLINENQVVVISGETGCGKTTQVAQFILDEFIKMHKASECNIVCTQPRRISAISVAERVAEERAEKLGVSVGFQIRLEKVKQRERGSILFCTAGILLKYMEGDPSLNNVSHVILDEIHERDVTSDFLITVLKEVIKYRSDIKIILMSATLNAEAFSKYYNNAPHINIPGFTYPVTEYFLEDVIQKTRFSFKTIKTPIWMQKMNNEPNQSNSWPDYIEPYLRQLATENKYSSFVLNELRKPESEEMNVDLIFELVNYVCQKDRTDGGILIFVTGFAEIMALINKLKESRNFSSSKYIIIPLHSQLPTVDQKRIFYSTPKGMRKIIVATNIAETSITIDDITVVIDCGFIKMSTLDAETGIEALKSQWVSCANASQRRGRAGRVKPGVCYHLFTKVRLNLLDAYQKPEILRKRLDDVILGLKMLQLGEAQPFLAKLMDPPEDTSVKNSISLLHRLGALDEQEALTPLGFHMAKLPIGAQCAKMLIMAALFSCLDPVLSVIAALDFKDGFQLSTTNPKEADIARLELSNRSNSDHILMHNAINGLQEATNKQEFCRKYFLSLPILELLMAMRKQFAEMLFNMNFIANADPKSAINNCNSNNLSLVKAVICSGLYPNIAIIKRNNRGKPIVLRSVLHEHMAFHPKSILSRIESVPSPLVVYHQRLKSAKLFIHDGTVVYPLPIVFFGDEFKRIHEESFNGIMVNGTMRFVCTESTSLIVEKLRKRLNEILEYKVSHPGFVDWTQDAMEVKVLRAIMEMITSEDMEDLHLSDFDDN